MFQQFNISRTGFGAYQKWMFNITNNIANANTPGFKQKRVELATLFPTILQDAQEEISEGDTILKKKKRGIELGSGVQIQAITQDFRDGRLEASNQEMDIALKGPGFFQFQRPDGSIVYSRAGNFTRDAEGNLMHHSGHLVEPPIRIPENATSFNVSPQGVVSSTVHDDEVAVEIGQLLIARFPNNDGLQEIGQNMFQETIESGEPQVSTPGTYGSAETLQSFREMSNVDIMRELMEMVMCSRGLQLLSKAMDSGSKMMEAGMSIVK